MVDETQNGRVDRIAFESLLAQYRGMAEELEERGGPEGDGELFEETWSLEGDILDMFGLPHTGEFGLILQERSRPPEAIYEKLASISDDYDETDVDPVVLLEQAKEEERDAMDVLPVIGVTTHVWTIRMYELFLVGVLTAEDAMDVFKASEPHLDVLGVVMNRLRIAREAIDYAECDLMTHLLGEAPD